MLVCGSTEKDENTDQEDDLAVGRFSHSLHSLEVSNLHSWCRTQDISGLSHELGALDLSPRSNDLGFTSSLGLRSHGEGFLQILREDDVADKHALDFNTPALCGLFNNVTDILRNFFSALNDILEDASSNDVS